jgi:hypothetical protein
VKYVFPVIILINFILFSSCIRGISKIDYFYQKTFPLIISTYNVDKSELYLNTHSPLSRPPSTFINLVGLHSLDENFKKKTYCLFYKVPQKSNKSLGRLQLISTKKSCQNEINSKPIAFINGIQELMIHLNDEDTIVERKMFFKNTLYIEFKKDEESRTLVFPLYNYSSKKKETFKRFSTSFNDNILKGIKISMTTRDLELIPDPIKTIGEYSDTYLNHNLKICHNFDKRCKEISKYSCNKCKFGWFNVVGNNNCKNTTLKYCGRNRCGEKGMPACVRGHEAALKMGLENNNGCYEYSPAGYCNVGLRTSCDGNVLICL